MKSASAFEPQPARRRGRRPRDAAFQYGLRFHRRGGKRPRAGRPKKPGAGPSHLARPTVSRHVPVHVTLKLARGVPSLRRQSLLATLERCLRAGKARFGMKLVHASFQHDHVHLLCEAENRRALARGVQGLAVRLARALNRALGRKGKLWKERYHARPLRSPRETRRGLAYVLLNGRSHAVRAGREWLPRTADPFSTAAFFDGWLERPRLYAVRLGARAAPGEELCCPPASYLLRALWKQHGLIHPDETPGVGRG